MQRFSIVVHEQSGQLMVAVSRDGMSVSVFGSRTHATDAASNQQGYP